MKAQDLKNSILQLAIQGKLVPQDPNDESAEVLYTQIQAEKQKLIKEGKIKKDKTLPPITDDEISFPIPSTWKWVRLASITYNLDYMRKPVAKSQRNNTKKLYDYYGATGAIDKVDEYIFDGQYLMIGEDGGNFYTSRDNSFIATGKFWANNHVHVLKNIICNIFYLKYFLDYCNFPRMGLITGIAVPKLNQERLNSIMIPLPPLAEQKRIVAKIEELEPLVKQYDKAETELSDLNEAFPEQLKKSILQYAIQGKLVPQDLNDEPADILYEKIQSEKQKLIKEGKIKKDKPLPPITDDEIPFPIPSTWKWVRLSDIVSSIPTKEHQILQSEILNQGKYPVVSQSQQLIEGYSDRVEKLYKHERPVLIFGDHTRCLKLIDFDFIVGADGVKILYPYALNEKYLYYAIQYFIINMINRGYSRHFQFIKDKEIPLPPLAEQKRIVAKVDELMQYCDKLVPTDN